MTHREQQLYTKVMGETQGPFTSIELKQLARSGKLLPDSFVRSGTTGDWVSADRVRGLSFSIPSAAPISTKLPPIRHSHAAIPTGGNSMLYIAIGCVAILSFSFIVALALFVFRSSTVTASSQKNKPNDTAATIEDGGGPSPGTLSTAVSSVESDAAAPTNSEPTTIKAPEITKVLFDIKGMKIGDPLTEEFARNHFPTKDKGKPDITGGEFIEIDGCKIFVLYQFDNFKLIGVALSFESGDFATVLAAYKQKFGVPPHSIRTETVSTRQNINYENVIATWETTSGPFIVQKYGSTITDGSATLHSPEYDAYWSRRQEKESKELGNKL
jgi:hypothetical protein